MSQPGSFGTRRYPHTATAAAFLLGGIGTGNVSINARGAFVDWELFNRPSKGQKLPFSFFALRAQEEGRDAITRVIEGPVSAPHALGFGYPPGSVEGLPRFARSWLSAEYPFARVDFEDDTLPLGVELEAFTPFIPLEAERSAYPAAVIRYRVTSRAVHKVDVSIVGSLPNVSGAVGSAQFDPRAMTRPVVNELRTHGSATGLAYAPAALDAGDPDYSSFALLTTAADPTVRAEWLPAHWIDHIQDFWDDFSSDGRLEATSTYDAPLGALLKPGLLKVGSVGGSSTIAPGESATFEFILAWHVPNRPAGWTVTQASTGADGSPTAMRTVRNHYATLHADAWDAATHLLDDLHSLEADSRAFCDALYGSTLPDYVIEAVASNITVLRSPTCYRLEDGSFLGWEGCSDSAGCCEGSCTHVWNYAQTVAFLFPELERSMRSIEFGLETDETGAMAFRTHRVFGLPSWKMLPATDGQLGTIVRLYRDWKLSGDDAFLRSVWDHAALALDFAFEYWDKDDDDVLDSQQHNTYDIEFFGPNSLSNSFFYAALAAGERMAEHLGDSERASRYRAARERGSATMDELLWNGEYYEQRLDDVDEHRYQYGSGCLSDQLVGQYLAFVAGLGHVLPTDHVRSALASIVRYNYRHDVGDVSSVQRIYAVAGEPGLLLCTWPRGGRPRLPFVYSDEVWTGIEYQVAASCIYEGLVDEGLTIVKAVRSRHDGVRRNPWNEVECGHHYARSMASWALLTALSGYECDLVEGRVSFAPRINEDDYRCFFSTGKSWGVYRQKRGADGNLERSVEVLHGEPVPGW